MGFGNKESNGNTDTELNPRRDVIEDDVLADNNGTIESVAQEGKGMGVVLAEKENVVSSNRK